MKRTMLAAVLTLAATLPALAGSAWIFGCCVVPLCHAAPAPNDVASSRQPPSTAPREKEQRVVVVPRPWSGGLQAAVGGLKPAAPRLLAGHRSFISLGATRCDRDVGLQILLATFLI